MKLAAKVQEWITLNEWNDKISYDDENQTSSVSFIYIINKQPFKVWVETDENKDMISVYVYAPFNALPNKRHDCSMLFNHINNNTIWGAIACDDENGSIRWRHSVDFEGTDVRSNNNLASGLKSRPRSCPYALVVRRSGV